MRKVKKTQRTFSHERLVRERHKGRLIASKKKNRIAKRKAYKRRKLRVQFSQGVIRSFLVLILLLLFPIRELTESETRAFDVFVGAILDSR